jgi:hypothetical protein
VLDHPLTGVGAGRFPGHGRELALREPDSPTLAADAQAHNFFLQLAAELGAPLALVVLGCTGLWLFNAWRASRFDVGAAAALAMCSVVLVHANLEHPLGSLTFLGVLGLLAGHLPDPVLNRPSSTAARRHPGALRHASAAFLIVGAMAFGLYGQVDRAMQEMLAQMQKGAPPRPTRSLNERLAAVPAWSPFSTYSELMTLVAAVPQAASARDLAARCQRAVLVGPSPHLLARCATVFQVAGDPRRATEFATSLCRLYPGSVGVLIQSMTLVEQYSPAAADVRSPCVDRVR